MKLLFVLLVAGLLFPGCAGTEAWVWDCNAMDLPAFAPDGTPNPCRCQGACVPVPPASLWKANPVLLWYGKTSEAPTSCPYEVPSVMFHAEPAWVNSCPFCACGPPACTLPTGLNASSTSSACQGPSYTPYAGSPSGSCSDNTMMPIAANGAKSLALLSPTVTPCAPHADTPKDQLVAWRKEAVVCSGIGKGDCDGQQLCVPSAPDGWMHCIESATVGDEDGVEACPAGYPTQITVYEKIDWKLACSDCACDPPLGSDCEADVSVYSDASCVAASQFLSHVVPLGAPQCDTVPPNRAVAGMTAAWVRNEPGMCLPTPSSGQPTGTVDVDHSTAHTYCCIQ